MLLYLIKHILILLFVVFSLFSIGNIIRILLKLNISLFFQRTFFNLFIGTVTFVTFNAIYFTHFKSILILNIFLYILFYIEYIKKKQQQETTYHFIDYKRLISFSIPIILLYFFYMFLTLNNIDNLPFWDDADIVCYSKFTWYIINSGNETNVFNYLDISLKTASPYHYFDLWLSGSISSIFKTNYMHTFQLISYPLGFLTIIFGFLGLLENFITKPISLIIKILSICVLTFTGIFFTKFTNLDFYNRYGYWYCINAFNHPKYIISYLYIIAFLTLFINKKEYFGILILLGLVIAQIATSLSILSSIFIYYTILIVYSKNRKYYKYIYSILSIAILILIFYLIMGKNDNVHSQNFNFRNIIAIFNISNLFFVLKQFIGDGLLGYLSMNILTLLIIFFSIIKKNIIDLILLKYRNIIILSILLFTTGLLYQFLLRNILFDNYQFFSTVATPLFYIIYFLILLYIFTITTKFIKLIIVLFIIFNLIKSPIPYNSKSIYNSEYLNETHEIFDKLNPIGVSIISKEYYIKYTNNSNPLFGTIAPYICIWNKNAHLIPISVFDIPKKDDYSNSVKLSPFYIFVKNQMKIKKFISIENSQIEFIKQNKIKYIITCPDVTLNKKIMSITKKIFIDKFSGEKFVLLKY